MMQCKLGALIKAIFIMRRPIASREKSWAKKVASALARRGVRPNAVSSASVLFAALAAICIVSTSQNAGHLADFALFCSAALFIQLRLLCNLFDGMLAVEFKQASPLGPIFNDLPDRPADVLILVACGYIGGALWMPMLGWTAAALALLTAYTRVLGAAIGAGEHFIGPMAKQHRMAIATIACLLSAVEAAAIWPQRAMATALFLVVIGCVLTVIRRLKLIASDLQAPSTPAAKP